MSTAVRVKKRREFANLVTAVASKFSSSKGKYSDNYVHIRGHIYTHTCIYIYIYIYFQVLNNKYLFLKKSFDTW